MACGSILVSVRSGDRKEERDLPRQRPLPPKRAASDMSRGNKGLSIAIIMRVWVDRGDFVDVTMTTTPMYSPTETNYSPAL